MKRTLWILGILLGLGVVAAIVCWKVCGECCCQERDGKEEDR